jgi:hypothetical protein
MARSNAGQRYDDSLASSQHAKMIVLTHVIGVLIGSTISALPLFM